MENSTQFYGDPKRRADSSIRGYIYQFWITVRTWIELAPDEFLYVEGAEDIDHFTSDGVTAKQIKDNKSSGNLTLGNAKVIKVINNFWKLKRHNQDTRLRFQYITTSDIETEKSQTLKGIVVWKEIQNCIDAKKIQDQVEHVKTLLLAHDDLDDSLSYFLKSSDHQTIKANLINPFDWLCNQPEIQDIKHLVQSKILKIGEPLGINVEQSQNLAMSLCEAVQTAAMSPKIERLTYLDFRQLLDNAISRSITATVPLQFLSDITNPEVQKALGKILDQKNKQPFSINALIDSEYQSDAILHVAVKEKDKETKKTAKNALIKFFEGDPKPTSEILSKEITSLENDINSAEQTIEEKKKTLIRLYLMQAAILYYVDHQSALNAYKSVVNLAPQNIHAWSRIGWLSISLGNLDDAENAIKKAGEIAGGTNLVWQAITWGDLGSVYQRRGDAPKALECHNKALKINEKIGRKYGELACKGNIANIIDTLSHDDDKQAKQIVLSIFEYLLNEYIKLGEQGQNTVFEIGLTYSNLCRTYMMMDELEKAKKEYEKSWAINSKNNFRENMARDLSNRGHIYWKEGDTSNAFECLEQSLEIEENNANKYGAGCDAATLAGYYAQQGNKKRANELYVKAMSLFYDAGADHMVQRVKEDLRKLSLMH